MSGTTPVEVRIDRRGPLRRAAVLEEGRLTDLHIDHSGRPSRLGDLYLGRVARVAAGLNAAFVDIGAGTPGLLGLADVRLGAGGQRPRAGQRIGTVLRAGQPVLVQVKADAVGDKGPVLTMDVSLPGRFLVMLPFGRGIAVSRRLARGAARGRLVETVVAQATQAQAGWIVRAGAAEVPSEWLAREADLLAERWHGLAQDAAAAVAPARLATGPDAARRVLVELGGRPVARIRVEGDELAAELAVWCTSYAPDLVPRLVRHEGPHPLFEEDDLEGVLARLAEPRVPLPGGGSLVIERTEALTVIDVNGGEQANPLTANLVAAREIGRQLRLRNLGGIVVVDFIAMRQAGDSERLLQALAAAVADDPVQTQVYGMSRLGLVELTRARRGPALDTLLAPSGPAPPTPACTAGGREDF